MIKIYFKNRLYAIKKEKIEYIIKKICNDENFIITNLYVFFKTTKKLGLMNKETLLSICEYTQENNGNIYFNNSFC